MEKLVNLQVRISGDLYGMVIETQGGKWKCRVLDKNEDWEVWEVETNEEAWQAGKEIIEKGKNYCKQLFGNLGNFSVGYATENKFVYKLYLKDIFENDVKLIVEEDILGRKPIRYSFYDNNGKEIYSFHSTRKYKPEELQTKLFRFQLKELKLYLKELKAGLEAASALLSKEMEKVKEELNEIRREMDEILKKGR